MFGLTEITVQLDEATKLAIIPTVVLPFTIVGMILTSLATWIAALFGVELKAEGPKRLFEVIMKPKILILGLLSNLLVYGAIQGGQYLLDGPYPLWWVKVENSNNSPSSETYSDNFTESIKPIADIKNLEIAWETKIESAIFGTPVISGESLFAGEDAGRVLELNLNTGKVLRKFEVGKPVMTSPLIWNQMLYAGEGIHTTHHARLYAFDLKSGKLAGAFESQGHIERAATPAEWENQKLLLIPSGKDGLNAVDPTTMKLVWHSPIGHIDSFPLANNEMVFVGTGLELGFDETPTKISALEFKTGKVIWEKTLPTSIWGKPIVWNQVVCFPVGDVYKNTDYGQLACYERSSGKEYFAFNTPGALISEPVLRGDDLIVADFHGKIYQFNLKNQKLDWTIQVPVKKYSYASVVVDSQDNLVLPGLDGIYVYSRKTQELQFTWKPEKWKGAYCNVVFYKDLWILADATGTIYGLKSLPKLKLAQ